MKSASEPETRNPKPETYFGEFITHSAEETFTLARSIGEKLNGGEVFLLKGDLGAGKTVFAKGLAAGLGIDPAEVTSPTFTLINVHEGRLRLYHIDLYRLDLRVCEDLGLQEIFETEKAVVVVEWGERLALVPAERIEIEMLHVAEAQRRIHIDHRPGASVEMVTAPK